MKRVRVEASIDRDEASPDSIGATQQYLTGALFERAENLGVALDWSSFDTYCRRKRGNVTIVQWARVL